ncbi:MAG: hypothetical protein KJ593_07325 [Candidatus Omnitrophica bacterium]|nr:hypothetical protein [Candidatus Omnitrophota bacterium]
MAGRNKIDWDNIKLTFIPADPDNPNPMNPSSHLSQEERREEIIDICARIWMRHCQEILESNAKICN